MAQGSAVAPAAEMEDYDFIFKIVVLGDSGVGKTNLVSRFTKDEFRTDSKATIGVEFATKNVKMSDGKMVKAQIWDTAGQERYRSIASSYYRGAVGALIMYDVTNRDSFKHLNEWKKELEEHAGKDALVVLVGNKIDLPDEKRAVRSKEGKSFARRNGLAFIETSALDSTGVSLAFERVLKQIYENRLAAKAHQAPSISIPSGDKGGNDRSARSQSDGKVIASSSSSGSMAIRRPGTGIGMTQSIERGKVGIDSDPDLRKYDVKNSIILPITPPVSICRRLWKPCLIAVFVIVIITVSILTSLNSLQDSVRYTTTSVPLLTPVGEGENKTLLDFVHCGTFFNKDTIKTDANGNVGIEILLLHDATHTKEDWKPVQDRLCRLGGERASVTAIDLSITSNDQGLKNAHLALINGKVLSGNPITIVTPSVSGNFIVEMIAAAALSPPMADAIKIHVKNWVVIGTRSVMPLPTAELKMLSDLGVGTLAMYGSYDKAGKAVHDALIERASAEGVEIKGAGSSPHLDKPKTFAKKLFTYVTE